MTGPDTDAALDEVYAARARELTTLLEITRDVTSNLSIESVLREILEKLKVVVDFTNATIVRLEGETFVNAANYLEDKAGTIPGFRFPVDNLLDRTVMQTRRPLIIPDVLEDDTKAARSFRRQAAPGLDTYYRGVRTWMRVPLISRGDIIGMLTLHHDVPNRYGDHDAELAMVFAGHAAIAMDNASLFSDLEKRSAELATLLNVARTISSTLDLETLLTSLLGQLRKVVEYDAGSVLIVEGGDLVLAATHGEGLPQPGTRYRLENIETTRRMLEGGAPRFIPDINADEPLAKIIRADLDAQSLGRMNSWMGVPMIARDRSIGLLNLVHRDPGFYTGVRVNLVSAFTLQAASAIENARLYQQARELAALEERQKLARELHDSVSQALYGIALGARTARTLLQRDPAAVEEPLEYIVSLAEAGLAEMRALIFELRPESLQIEGLAAAIRKQADSLRARHGLEVEVDLGEEPDVDLNVKEAFYRIAQEALHNIVRHARARRVRIRLAVEEGALTLWIDDDGVGFDDGGDFPGHLGLRSMRERIEGLGGAFRLRSAPGEGTVLEVGLQTEDGSQV